VGPGEKWGECGQHIGCAVSRERTIPNLKNIDSALGCQGSSPSPDPIKFALLLSISHAAISISNYGYHKELTKRKKIYDKCKKGINVNCNTPVPNMAQSYLHID